MDKYSSYEAITDKYNNIHMTYGELKEEMTNFATGLQKLGVKKGDKVYALISNYQSLAKSIQIAVPASKKESAKMYRLSEKYGFVFEREIPTEESWVYLAPGTVYFIES